MKAARYYGIHDIRYEEIDKPVHGADEVLIRVAYSGICGSDLHIYNKGMFIINIPETMGHEFVGIVEAVGENVKGYKPGDCVTANPMVPCHECDSCHEESYNTCENLSFIGECRQGCFAEYIVMDEKTLIKIPVKLSADAGINSAAGAGDPDEFSALKPLALTEPLAVALNICKRAQFKPDERIAVIGAGPIGMLTCIAAKSLYGVKDITAVDLSEVRLELAEKVGADHTYQMLPDGLKFDKIVDAAGAPVTFNTALKHIRANGSVYVVSIFEKEFIFDINLIVSMQASVVGCNVYTETEMKEAAEAIALGRVDVSPLISRVFDLTECAEAFKLVASADKSVAKVLFKP
ncbi:MAG: alcohol dehydrogenase catalytic domain-containing protein [Eubacteriales bacterium]|nr:alcohol dehydrogenase catalytic domain-containing protein [Eubacteriales bacterium]